MTTPPEALREMGADFIYAADALAETMRHLEQGMEARLKFLRRCVTENTDRLAKLKEEIGTLPEQIAKWDAEAARLESQTAEDLLRQALGAVILHPQPPGEVIEAPLTQPQPELYRAGLPPERLRKVWAEWEDEEGDVVTFKDEHYHWSNWRASMPIKRIHDHAWSGLKLKPLGTSWSEVEAMADERGPYCKGSWAVGNNCKTCWRCMETKPKEAPTLLDLTKLPPGTVCEATGQIARGSHVILPGERFAFAGSSTEFLARVRVIERDESFDVPTVVYARVVEVPR